MRRYIGLMPLALMLSLIIGMQLVIACIHVNDFIPAKVNIYPHLLCLDYYNKDDDADYDWYWKWAYPSGKWMTAYITLPKGYNVKNINGSTVTLAAQGMSGNVSVSKYYIWRKTFIAKFDRASVVNLLLPLIEHMSPYAKQRVTLVVTGNLYDGSRFQGQDTITVFFWGK